MSDAPDLDDAPGDRYAALYALAIVLMVAAFTLYLWRADRRMAQLDADLRAGGEQAGPVIIEGDAIDISPAPEPVEVPSPNGTARTPKAKT